MPVEKVKQEKIENKISACVLVNNEEETISRCLNSISGVVDEIIVVHDGECHDRTLDICRKYKAKIFVREKRKNFDSHRVFTYEQASNPWIFQIDGDEYLSRELAANLRELVKAENVSTYEFLWPYWDGEKKLTNKWPYKRCLYRKDKISFLGVMNYFPKVDSGVVKKNYVLEHKSPYNNFSFASFKDKWKNRAKKQAEIYLTDFTLIKTFNYRGQDWPRNIKFRNKHPIIVIPIDIILTLYRDIASGAYREGLKAARFIMMDIAYKAMVNYYIFNKKRLKKITKE